jgi:predicted ATP-grasp superfamily ATP-dependent carboligase
MAPPDRAAPLDRDATIMIAAFEGWNDAGSSASAALDHLAKVWGANEYLVLDAEDYHDFQVSRPTVSRNENGEPLVSWPGTVISTVTIPSQPERTVLLARGIEPSMRWRQFCREVLDAAEDFEVTALITLGALLVDAPHSRPLPIYLSSEEAETRRLLDIERSDYEGPTGITGVLGHEAELRGISVVSGWVGVPHYVAHPPSPKATRTLLGAVERLVGAPIDLGDLEYEAEAWERGVDDLASEDDEISAHVKTLEEVTDAASLPEASGDAIAAEFERFLRRNEGGTAR